MGTHSSKSDTTITKNVQGNNVRVSVQTSARGGFPRPPPFSFATGAAASVRSAIHSACHPTYCSGKNSCSRSPPPRCSSPLCLTRGRSRGNRRETRGSGSPPSRTGCSTDSSGRFRLQAHGARAHTYARKMRGISEAHSRSPRASETRALKRVKATGCTYLDGRRRFLKIRESRLYLVSADLA